jgi:hypothetical protein
MFSKLLMTKFELLRPISKRCQYLNWLSPLLVMVSPFIVAFFTSLPFAMNISLTPFQSPLDLISSVMFFLVNHLPSYLFIYSGLLFLCATNFAQVTLGRKITLILVMFISVYLTIKIWSLLPSVNIASWIFCYKNLSSRLYISPQFWVYIVSSVLIFLLLLNLITVIGQEKPA